MQPEQDSEPNSSLNSVSFERSTATFKLSATSVRPNLAGMFDKSCFNTAKAFNISDFLRFSDKPCGRLPVLTLGKQKLIFETHVPFLPHSHTLSNNPLFPCLAATCQRVCSVSRLDINRSTFSSSVARFFVACSCNCCQSSVLSVFDATCQAFCSEASLAKKYLLLISSGVSSSLAHYIIMSNTFGLSFSAATCQAVLPQISLAKSNLQLNSSAVSWSLACSHNISGVSDRHNVPIWGSEKPHVVFQNQQGSPEVTVWCGLLHNKVIGPFF